MTDVVLRPASAKDFPTISRLIRQVQINPTGLDWHRFVVAVDSQGMLVGCGQLKPHRGGIVELASIAVVPSFRKSGIARLIIERLLVLAPRPLYLTCRSRLGSFYMKWGFRALVIAEMPPYYRRLAKVMSIVGNLFLPDERLLVMVLQ
jgi:N-acetylglutamate synthase-like GNAT family acetyltransferase